MSVTVNTGFEGTSSGTTTTSTYVESQNFTGTTTTPIYEVMETSADATAVDTSDLVNAFISEGSPPQVWITAESAEVLTLATYRSRRVNIDYKANGTLLKRPEDYDFLYQSVAAAENLLFNTTVTDITELKAANSLPLASASWVKKVISIPVQQGEPKLVALPSDAEPIIRSQWVSSGVYRFVKYWGEMVSSTPVTVESTDARGPILRTIGKAVSLVHKITGVAGNVLGAIGSQKVHKVKLVNGQHQFVESDELVTGRQMSPLMLKQLNMIKARAAFPISSSLRGVRKGRKRSRKVSKTTKKQKSKQAKR